MLKIIEIGKFACDHCKDRRKKNGVELESYGFATMPEAIDDRRLEFSVKRFVWREQIHLCLDHLKAHIARMIEEPIGQIKWQVHKQAAMRRGYVNTTYEEAKKKKLI